MCFIDGSSAIRIKVKAVTHHCSFHSLQTVAESFAHSIPAFFLSDTKAFPISFWQTKFYLNQNKSTKLGENPISQMQDPIRRRFQEVE